MCSLLCHKCGAIWHLYLVTFQVTIHAAIIHTIPAHFKGHIRAFVFLIYQRACKRALQKFLLATAAGSRHRHID